MGKREILRRAILDVADANLSRYGLSAVAFKLHVSAAGLLPDVSVEQIQPELEYLAEKELLVEVAKHLSPENRLWRITARGRDFVAQGGA